MHGVVRLYMVDHMHATKQHLQPASELVPMTVPLVPPVLAAVALARTSAQLQSHLPASEPSMHLLRRFVTLRQLQCCYNSPPLIPT